MTMRINFDGRTGAAPELNYRQDGTPYAKLSVAHQERRKNSAGQWEDGELTWVTCWLNGRDAEAAAEGIGKGQRVHVDGVLTVGVYKDKPQVTVNRAQVTVYPTASQSQGQGQGYNSPAPF